MTEMKVTGQRTAARDESLMGLPRREVGQCAHDTVFARIYELRNPVSHCSSPQRSHLPEQKFRYHQCKDPQALPSRTGHRE